jgi:HemX protein
VIQALTVLVPVAYFQATFLFLLDFLVERRGTHVAARRWVVAAALALHGGLFAARAVEAGGLPDLGGWTALSAVALCLVLLHLWTARGRHAGTGLLIFTAAGTLQLLASALGPLEAHLAPDRPAAFYLVHVFSILVASAALVLSGLYGLLYLLLYRSLRQRRFGPLFDGLPSLEDLARSTRRGALAAFVLLAIGINGGIWWAHAAQVPGFGYTDPLVLVLLGLMLHFGLVSGSGHIPGLTARHASLAAAGGFTLLLVSLVAMQVVRISFHEHP